MKSVKNVTRLRCDDEIRRHIEEIGKREREREREKIERGRLVHIGIHAIIHIALSVAY